MRAGGTALSLFDVARRRASGVKLVAYSDAVAFGGAEQSLAHLLARLDASFEVAVLAVDPKVGDVLQRAREGSPLHLVRPAKSKWDIGPFREHLRAVRALRPDIFHANLWTTFSGQYGLSAALLTPGVRAVAVEQSPLPTSSGLQRRLRRLAARRLAAHVAVGERAARQTEEAIGLRAGSVRTIYNGVPDQRVEPLPRLAAGPIVGAIGRLSHEKGFDLAVRVLRDLPEATLVLVGDGPERGRLEELAAKLGVASRLILVGWSDEPRRYLPGFDVLLLPSRHEAFPLVVIEGMLAGIPVVASDVGSVREAILEGETGYLVPAAGVDALAERLRRVLGDADLARRFGSRGRDRALQLFTAEAMTRSFEALYRKILA
jgi:glycosyltransferase involved in cell wall biosynthesis